MGAHKTDRNKDRIVIVSRRFVDGAAAINRLLSYAKGFAEAGREVDLIFCIARTDHTRFHGTFPGVRIHYLWEEQPKWLTRRKALSYLAALFQLARRIGRQDTVFVCFREVPLFQVVSLLSRRVFAETTEHPFFSRDRSVLRRMEFNLSMVFRRHLKGLFVISESLRDYYVGKGFPTEKVRVINMFVDTDRFRGPFSKPTEPYIAYCGTVSRSKDGVDCLIRAFARFRSRHPDYKLYIIGKSETQQEYEGLRKLAADLGVNEAILFTGKVSAADMPDLLGGARILALARPDNLQSRNGFPTKLGEYLACGKPVVVTRVGEIGTFLHDGENCLLSAPDNPEAFAEKLMWAAEHPLDAARIGEEGRKMADTAFSYRTQTAEALAFMDRITRLKRWQKY